MNTKLTRRERLRVFNRVVVVSFVLHSAWKMSPLLQLLVLTLLTMELASRYALPKTIRVDLSDSNWPIS